MLRDPELILGRLARLFGTLLNANSDKLRPDIIEGLSQWSVAYALDFEPTENEVIAALMPMSNAKTGGPDQISIEVPTLGLNHEPTVLRELHLVIKLVWHQRKVPQRWRDAVMNILHRKKDRVDCGNYRGISLLTHARRSLLNVVATRVGAYYIAKELLLEGQCGFHPHCPTTDMLFTIRRLQELGRKARVPLFLCFVDPKRVFGSVDRTLLWQVLAPFGVPPHIIEVIRQFPDAMRA